MPSSTFIVVAYLILLAISLVAPFLSSHGRTISRKDLRWISGVLAFVCLVWTLLTGGWSWVVGVFLFALPIALVFIGDFRIIYNVQTKSVRRKIHRLLKSTFCDYQDEGHRIQIAGIGSIALYSVSRICFLEVHKEKNSPKGQIIFENLFKIFYDHEY